MPNAIVLTIDGLGTLCLGPYGNTWVETPALNRIACDSVLAEQAVVDASDPALVLRSLWRGGHALTEPTHLLPPLPQRLPPSMQSVVLSDDLAALEDRLPVEQWFRDVVQVEQPLARRAASAVDRTQTARLISAAMNWLEDNGSDPFLLWIHSRGLRGAWDAPTKLRNQFADEGDPLPDHSVDPPARRWTEPVDPDEVLPLVHAYAAQVVVWDMCLEAMWEFLQTRSWWNETLFLLTAPRGYPLGEHRHAGLADDVPLYGELLQVPWITRYPDSRQALRRTQRLLRPSDIHDALSAWLLPDQRSGSDPPSEPRLLDQSAEQDHQSLLAVARDQRAMRSAAWFCRSGEQADWELFAKPGDRWEVNEVAGLCPEVIELFQQHLAELETALKQNDPPPPIPELLREGLE